MKLKLKRSLSRFYHPLTEKQSFISALDIVSSSSSKATQACLFVGAAKGVELFVAEVELPEIQLGNYILVGRDQDNKSILCEGHIEITTRITCVEVSLNLSFSLNGFLAISNQLINWELCLEGSDNAIAKTSSLVELYFLANTPILNDTASIPVEFLRHIAELTKSVWPEVESKDNGLDNVSALSNVATIVRNLFGLTPPKYNNYDGAPSYTSIPDFNHIILYLNRYLSVIGNPYAPEINCYDEAALVQYYLGAVSSPSIFGYCYIQPFGYLKQTDLIGWGQCNNPFFGNSRFSSSQITSETDSDRSFFGNHAFCLIVATDTIADSCAGPHLGTESKAAYLAAATDGVTPIPPALPRGTTADITVYNGVTSVTQQTQLGKETTPMSENLESFKKAVQYDDGKFSSIDSDAIFPQHPPLVDHPALGTDSWKVVYQELLPGYPELSRYSLLQNGVATIQLSIYVSSDGVETARQRFLNLGSTHQMSVPIFEAGPTSLGECAAISKNSRKQRVIWVDRNLTFDLSCSNCEFEVETLAQWYQEQISLAQHIPKGTGLIEYLPKEIKAGEVVSIRSMEKGREIHPLINKSTTSFRLVSHESSSLSLLALETGEFLMSFVLIEPESLRAEQCSIKLVIN